MQALGCLFDTVQLSICNVCSWVDTRVQIMILYTSYNANTLHFIAFQISTLNSGSLRHVKAFRKPPLKQGLSLWWSSGDRWLGGCGWTGHLGQMDVGLLQEVCVVAGHQADHVVVHLVLLVHGDGLVGLVYGGKEPVEGNHNWMWNIEVRSLNTSLYLLYQFVL